MCGRYNIDDHEKNLEMQEIFRAVYDRYNGTPELASMKTGEIFPTDSVPVLALEKDMPGAFLMKWGFPRFNGSGVIINARAETAVEKSMFRSSIASRRCLIPATGFYEWQQGNAQKSGNNKTKYLLRLKDTPVIYFAGIFSTFTDKSGRQFISFVIITTEANKSMASIHNRMPYILTRQNKEIWLTDSILSQAMLKEKCEEQLVSIAV